MNLKEQLKYVFDVMRFSAESSWLVSHCRDFTMNPRVRYLIKLLVAPFCVFKCFPVKDVPGRSGLALVLIAKNEAPYIEEWINFHRKQGVSHFFIYDNESTDNLHEVLKPYIESGLVRIISSREEAASWTHMLKLLMHTDASTNILPSLTLTSFCSYVKILMGRDITFTTL